MDNQLYHHGVKGMKWGVRKKSSASDKAYVSRRTARFEKKVNRQRKVVESWKDASPIKDKNGNTIFSSSDIKDIGEAATKHLMKLERNLLISKKRDAINRGESVVGRLYNKITGADKIQAEMEYDIERRAKVNKAWRD